MLVIMKMRVMMTMLGMFLTTAQVVILKVNQLLWFWWNIIEKLMILTLVMKVSIAVLLIILILEVRKKVPRRRRRKRKKMRRY